MLPLTWPIQQYLGNKLTPLTQIDFFDQTEGVHWANEAGVTERQGWFLYFAYDHFRRVQIGFGLLLL